MKFGFLETKINGVFCSFCSNKNELIPKLSQKIECKDCNCDHYLELYICVCGEHYYLYQSQELLRKRSKQ